jgi:hypothetical protein
LSLILLGSGFGRLILNVFFFQYWSVDPLTLYGPVVEHYTVENGFLYQEPHQMWKNGNFKEMPWMTGTVTNDGAVRSLGLHISPELPSRSLHLFFCQPSPQMTLY